MLLGLQMVMHARRIHCVLSSRRKSGSECSAGDVYARCDEIIVPFDQEVVKQKTKKNEKEFVQCSKTCFVPNMPKREEDRCAKKQHRT
jgi:hypothetical protein